MKEKIVVANKAFLNATDFVCIEDVVKDLKVEYTKEQVPENWEDLKELCNDLKKLCKNYIIEIFDDAIFIMNNELVLLKVYEDGEIKDSNSEIIAENRTPAQMWQIIKNLIGEE